MREAVIAGTNVRVSRFGYGTGSLHHAFSSGARQNLLQAAASSGMTHFDTAPYYGYGLAESDLGRFLRGQRSRFTVATKVGLYPWGQPARHAASVWGRKAIGRVMPAVSSAVADWSVERARRSLDESLRRLGTDYVDFLFLHEPDPAIVPHDSYLDWLKAEAARGRIRAWGLAGLGNQVATFVHADSALSQVVQTKDSLQGREAQFLLDHGRPLQFTYGYFSAAREPSQALGAGPAEVLKRNPSGTILVSTQRPERLKTLAEAAL